MRAISLWQPWAGLVAAGWKQCETRSWPTRHRGLIAIHAAKKAPSSIIELECKLFGRRSSASPWHRALRSMGYQTSADCWAGSLDQMPRGGIVAICRLTNCVVIDKDTMPYHQEVCFGDYTFGRFKWHLEVLWRPENGLIPSRGRQGIFTVDDEILSDAGFVESNHA